MRHLPDISLRTLCLAGTLLLALTLAPSRVLAQDLPDASRIKALPAGAKEIASAVASAKAGDAITLRGRVANAKDAFTAGRAEFILVDDGAAAAALKTDAGKVADRCTLPVASRATVQLVDAKDAPLTYSLEGRGGLAPGAEVFVTGKVISPATGDMPAVIHATGLHIPRGGLPAGFLLAAAPESAPDVADARKGIKKGDKIVLKGRIGGSKEPFVKERAVFTVVGRGLTPCSEHPDDTCKTPWDYCCDPRDQISANSATIQIVDAKGAPVRTDIKGRWDIKELSEVIVVGTVAEASGKTLIVSATGIFVVTP